jgi:hypothetical protein
MVILVVRSVSWEYALICQRVRSVIEFRWPDGATGSIGDIFTERLALQTEILRQRVDVQGIIYDRHLKLAVEYFCLDHVLLLMAPDSMIDHGEKVCPL